MKHRPPSISIGIWEVGEVVGVGITATATGVGIGASSSSSSSGRCIEICKIFSVTCHYTT